MDEWSGKKKLDCKEFERLIPDFIGRKMDYPTLLLFSEHRDSCEECREELAIQFLVSEGMHRLEDGNVFDLQFELNERLEEMKRKINFNSAFLYLGTAVEIVAACFLMTIFVWILL